MTMITAFQLYVFMKELSSRIRVFVVCHKVRLLTLILIRQPSLLGVLFFFDQAVLFGPHCWIAMPFCALQVVEFESRLSQDHELGSRNVIA
jgi:hypothetical protein